MDKKFGRPRLLIVGCGDIGLRVVALLRDRYRIIATTTTPGRCATIRAAGAIPVVADLDRQDPALARLAGLADLVICLVPPSPQGQTDMRVRRLAAIVPDTATVVYISTTGVYGSAGGQWVQETSRTDPQEDRSRRRRDAEQVWRRRASRLGSRAVILRVAGIYAADRLPLTHIRKGLPVLPPEEDGLVNLIHADDLARLIVLAISRGRPQRVCHAADGHPVMMGQYLRAVAQATGLPVPGYASRAQVSQLVSAQMLATMTASRRVANGRIRQEWGARLRYPDAGVLLPGLSCRYDKDSG